MRSSLFLGLTLACVAAVHGLHVPTTTIPSGLPDTRQRHPSLAQRGESLKHGSVRRVQALAPLRGGGEQDVTGFIFYLFKAIVGSGVLSLSSSVARFTNNPKMLAPALLLSASFAILSGYCYALIGEVCGMVDAHNYQEAWAKSISTATAWIPGMACTSQTMVACICYSIIIGDLSNDLMKSLGVRGWAAERNNLLAAISAVVLLPLCLLRSLAALSYTSMLGVMGVLYTTVFMALRYFQGSYAKGGEFFKELAQKPSFGNSAEAIKALILMATLNTAYHAHYDAPKFFHQMIPKTVQQFNKLVYPAFIAAGIINCLIMSTGFLTFGGVSQGLILNNYATSDNLAVWGRLAITASILFGYPLAFNGFRTGAFALAGVKNPSQAAKDAVAVVTVVATTGIAMVMRDLGFLAAFAGALLGSGIIYVFPALMHMSATKTLVEQDQKLPAKKRKGLKYDNKYYLSQVIAVLGSMLGLVGATVSYLQAFTDVLG